MAEMITGLFRADFLPHGWCYRWDPNVVWLHVASDLMIALSYYSIPIALIYIVRRRGDLAFPWMFWLFGTFILACGTTHLMSVLVVWQPWYRIDGLIKLVTGFASVLTAILLWRIAPAVVAFPGPRQLREINEQLAAGIAERKQAEAEVRMLNADLEQRVRVRTLELQEANQKLLASENRLRSILDGCPALVFLKGLDGRFQFVNREFENTFGVSREEVSSKTDIDLFGETAAESYAAADRKVLESRIPHEFEETASLGNEIHTYMSIKFPLFDEAGEPSALCGIASDITERKKAEESLRRYNAELEQFAYVAAHDLQEPLRNVKSYSQLLARRYNGLLGDDGIEFINYITTGVDRMHALIEGLQSWSELDRDRGRAEWVSADAVVRATEVSMGAAIRDAGATITWESLPQVRIDHTQLGQLFQNLIGNAIKYRSDAPPVIHISAHCTAHECEFVVKDNGIGLEMQYAEQIFGVFRRLHGRDVPGTGIGLAICKKIVESRGGRIWVRSEPGRGSEFHFTLPAWCTVL